MTGEAYVFLQKSMSADSSTLPPSIILSPIDVQLLDSYLNKKSNVAMVTFAYTNSAKLLQHPPNSWPLPVWLGGRYVNVERPIYAPHVHTSMDYFLSSFLHLAACTTKHMITPYVTHNRPSISVRLSNGQFSSFPNRHFFEQTSFEKFELLEPEYFRNRPLVTFTRTQDDRKDEEEVEAALSPLTDLTETDDDGSSDISTDATHSPLPPPLPPIPVNVTNLPFTQTFVANIFIY